MESKKKEFELVYLNDSPEEEPISIMPYGATGSGKTWFAGTAGDRTLIINTGKGLSTLKAPAFRAKHDYNPMLVNINLGPNSHDQTCDAIDYAFTHWLDRFDTIVIDDASSLRRGAMWKAIQINSDLNKSTTLANEKKFGTIVPQVQDYGEEMSVVEQFLSSYTDIFKSHNKHFILTAHEKLSFKKGDKIGDPPILVKIRPGFTGTSFPDTVPGFFDEVWWFHVEGKGERRKFRATTLPSEKITAKTRWNGIFKEDEEDCNFLNIVERIRSFQRKHTKDQIKAIEQETNERQLLGAK